MQKAINDVELTPSHRLICSDDIHNQLQGNELAFTLFDFCINPSHEDKCKECILSRIYAKHILHNSSPRVTGGMFCINPSHG